MSSILKRKSFSEELSSDSGEELEVKRARMAQNKTPVSLLYEMCTKQNQKPQFLELAQNDPEIKDYLRSHEKKFWIKCCALGRSAIQGGPTKKSAQHGAAQIVLHKLEMNTDESDDEVEKVNKGDFVTDLLNLCVLKNYHKPQFNCIDSYGPSHDPSFVYECRLDSIVRTATANNKNQSKQMAAKEVFEILRASFPDMEKKVAVINEKNLVKEESRRKITTYLKMKELDKLDTLGSTVADRSNYFLRHPNSDFIEALKAILEKKDIDDGTKYKELIKELETMWKCNIENFFETGLKEFECQIDFEQFTVNLVAPEGQLPKKVITYFSEMLNIPCH